ncbi:membrane protein insertase YidC [Variovorax sp.]|jgi:YidC/Oxa1 family membrane protein insertase|uniref:membrane protein insertase YidC n=2 Tax=Variovorax sp. TaxID=1871043 RepID=UPI0011FBD68A|nr:membrane protein insertase YidC [Variovorax sp.]TAJ67491.1 MAG: membrane protein insertase YidC [Variovorax sp.]
MNDIRRTILWVIFGFSLVLLWDQWQVFNGNKPTFLPSTKPAVTAPAPTTGAAGSSVPSASAAPGASAGAVPTQAAAAAPKEQVTVTTDLFKATIDSEGGTVNYLELLKYDENDRTKHVVLFENGSPATRYLAQTGLLNQVDTGERFPNHLTPMAPKAGPREMAAGQNTLEVGFESAPVGGLKYVKTYVFHRGDYAIGVRHEVVNVSDQPRDAQLYMQLLRHGTVAASTMFGTNTFTGPAAYTNEKKFHKLDFKDITKGKVEPPPAANDGWIAMVQHYFVSAWLLRGDPASEGLKREFRVKDLGDNLYTIAMVATLPKIAPGATQVVNSTLFAGPEEEKKLEAIAPGLDLVKDYGIFAIISKPLYWLLNQLHGLIGNWGWSIVALVVLLKAAFYWLNAKAYASMAKMKAINPKIMEMRERLKDKPQEMQQEMMRIYKTEKVNPMGGCFPIVIQIPVFIALYWVLLSSVEMRHAPWIGWITDLSAPDPWYILPIVMTATSLLQTWLNPTPPDPMQAKLMWIMPLAFSVMFIFFPAGLVLYWITNNILSIAQQWVINKRLGVLGK